MTMKHQVKIGNWVRREKWGSTWHVVESVVADDAFTNCGRRMTNEPNSGGNLVVSVDGFSRDGFSRCRICRSHA